MDERQIHEAYGNERYVEATREMVRWRSWFAGEWLDQFTTVGDIEQQKAAALATLNRLPRCMERDDGQKSQKEDY